MKHLILLATFLLMFGACFAQKSTASQGSAKKGQKGKTSKNKNAIGGMILDAHRHPIPDVQTFIYPRADSSIAASGYADATGYFETNSVLPGKYDLKVVYPNNKNALVTGIIVKKGVAMINLTMDTPPGDTLILSVELLPKPVEKKKPGGDAKQKANKSASVKTVAPVAKSVASTPAPKKK